MKRRARSKLFSTEPVSHGIITKNAIIRVAFVSRLSLLLRSRPKPRCPECRKLNRVYLTGGSYLSKCVHCGTPLQLEKTLVYWGVLVFLGVCALALAVAVPLLYVR